MSRRLIVTHHAPDLDAITSVWLLKRFDAEHFADAYVAFVDPGQTLPPHQVERFDTDPTLVVHVDTGLGEFDHHQADRGLQHLSASLLVHQHILQMHPELANHTALTELVKLVTDLDHFGECQWPDANNPRYSLMLHEMLEGFQALESRSDESQLEFGMQCLDCAFASLKENVQARALLPTGQKFALKIGECLAIETGNDGIIKVAQKEGFQVVVKRAPDDGSIRIKARPDADINLRAAADKIAQIDPVGTWYNHPSGKMLLNGSRKHLHQKPTSLSLNEIVQVLKELYG